MNMQDVRSAPIIKGIARHIGVDFKDRLKVVFAFASQFLVWPFIFVLFHLFFRIKITGAETLHKVSKPFMIIANHITWYDSFIFRLTLGPFTKNLPLRFMAVKKFDWPFLNFLARIGIINLVYNIFGVFTFVQGESKGRGLMQANAILKDNGIVVMYPEGGINKSGEIGLFKKGAAVLSIQTGVPAIPVSFRLRKGSIRKILYVNVGDRIKVEDNISVQYLTDIFREEIINLYQGDKV